MGMKLLKAFKENFGIRIFALFSILIFIISLSFTVFFTRHQSRSLTSGLIKKGEILAEILSYNSRIAVFAENEDLLKTPVEGVFQQEEVTEVSVFTLERELLVHQEGPEKTIKGESIVENTIFERLTETQSQFHILNQYTIDFWAPVISSSGFSSEESLYFDQRPLQRKDQVIGFVKISMSKALLNNRIRSLLFQSIIMGIAFLILGSGVTFFVVKGITRPLGRLTQGVKTLGLGGVVERIPIETQDEIGKLARAFNTMSQSLRRRETEKRKLEEQLIHIQKMEAIGTLAGGIAHDFNNILSGIMGYTDLALSDVPEETHLRQYLNEIIAGCTRATDLVKQILTFSRQSQQERKPIELSLIAKEALKMLRASLPTTIEIQQNIETSLHPVLADPTQMHQVLMNLCTNASHAMRDKGGILEVDLEEVDILQNDPLYSKLPCGKYQRLTVKDTGSGMDRSVMERIFDPYFTTKKLGEGTGMGLAVVHGIVKSHEGTITVNSELKKGTTFQVLLPTIEGEAKAEIADPTESPQGNERILLVDDEATIVEIGQDMLNRLGYEVITKTSSIEALKVFRKKPEAFDLVITDQTMPNMTGADLAREIMRIRPNTPIILCTGFSEVMSEAKAKDIGIRKFVMKPIIGYELAKIIRDVLDKEKEKPVQKQ